MNRGGGGGGGGGRCGGERVRELRSNDSKFVAVILDCTVLEREI